MYEQDHGICDPPDQAPVELPGPLFTIPDSFEKTRWVVKPKTTIGWLKARIAYEQQKTELLSLSITKYKASSGVRSSLCTKCNAVKIIIPPKPPEIKRLEDNSASLRTVDSFNSMDASPDTSSTNSQSSSTLSNLTSNVHSAVLPSTITNFSNIVTSSKPANTVPSTKLNLL